MGPADSEEARQRDEEIDLLLEAPNAVWSSGAGRLKFSHDRNSPDGFAIYPKPHLLLEDESYHELVLETHPRWTDDGWIRGEFWVPHVGTNHHFLAQIGFIAPMDGPLTNGVTVLIHFENTVLCEVTKLYDGHLKMIDIDMSHFSGRSGLLTIEVGTNGDSTQDWLVWLNPRIGPQDIVESSPAQDRRRRRLWRPRTGS